MVTASEVPVAAPSLLVQISCVVITPTRPVVSSVLPVCPAMATPSSSQTVSRAGAGLPLASPAVRVRMLPSVVPPAIVGAAMTAGAARAADTVRANVCETVPPLLVALTVIVVSAMAVFGSIVTTAPLIVTPGKFVGAIA